jgi:hypothetical protein
MAHALDRDKLLDAFDEIGRAAIAAGTRLEIAVYGGSALMLASNFRYNTEHVDIAAIDRPWPAWLEQAIDNIAGKMGWAADWLNDGVAFHLSALADQAPTAPYMLALKLKAIRVTDPLRGEQERLDILNLMRVVGVRSIDEAIAILSRYFPVSGASAEKQRFLLKNMKLDGAVHAPKYPG